ncbi:hypothetical protein GCM10010466_41280 [Planomonospora alba]|uniref:DUF2267 domain-containing protein n=1 Tax=Planomonospora alba TaxID=161354 RepID=A0ABP6NFB5_9ACTN
MNEGEFIKVVCNESGLSRDQAEILTQATLETLSERLTPEEADDLAAQLPESMQDLLISDRETPDDFGLDEFVRRVSERSGADVSEVREDVSAVFSALRLAVTPGELDDVLAQLPREFAEVL